MVDFDLLGSSIEAFMFANYEEDTDTVVNEEDVDVVDVAIQDGVGLGATDNINGISFKITKKAQCYLNEFFYTDNRICDNYINTVSICSNYKETGESFDMLICSPHQKDKNMFKATAETQYIEQIDYGYFKTMVITLLNTLNLHKYTDIIFDMPPNSDSYTDVIFEILYRYTNPLNFRFKVEMLLISSLDFAHFNANVEWVKNEMICCDWKNTSFGDEGKDFKLVFNDTVNYEELTIKPKALKALLQKRLSLFNDKLSGYIKIDYVSLYKYDKQAALSTTQDKGVVFGKIELEEVKE